MFDSNMLANPRTPEHDLFLSNSLNRLCRHEAAQGAESVGISVSLIPSLTGITDIYLWVNVAQSHLDS